MTVANFKIIQLMFLLRCIRVEEGESGDVPVGYQLSVKLVPDITAESLPALLRELRSLLAPGAEPEAQHLAVDVLHDKCPQAGMTYLEKVWQSKRFSIDRALLSQDFLSKKWSIFSSGLLKADHDASF